MSRIIAWSLLTLGMIYLVARACGLTPEQVESQILLADINVEEGAAFRRENGARPGVVTLPNGLQVELLAEGAGTYATEDDWVQVHYRGWHIDGREFENSWRRGEPATVTVARTIPGWRQVLTSIPVGTRARLVVPPELAYGRPGSGIIGPEETLGFELELLAVVELATVAEPEDWEKPVPNLR
jgi:FKBP-type peptidyl-prolyl cis-trans isomerase FkpA/FKBP-type peptidyl-prolyl cis-trans isomerase FklB